MKYKYINPSAKGFDAVDPEIEVPSYGLYKRSEMRSIVRNAFNSLESRSDKLSDEQPQVTLLQSLLKNMKDRNLVYSLIQADIEASKELEHLRRKGGQRKVKIPDQV